MDIVKALDIRYVYLLHRNGEKSRCLMSARVVGAERKESILHEKFKEQRFVIGSRSWGYKIGISNNIDRRITEINDNFRSGKTEWFKLNPFQVLYVVIYLGFWDLLYKSTALLFLIVLALVGMLIS